MDKKSINLLYLSNWDALSAIQEKIHTPQDITLTLGKTAITRIVNVQHFTELRDGQPIITVETDNRNEVEPQQTVIQFGQVDQLFRETATNEDGLLLFPSATVDEVA